MNNQHDLAISAVITARGGSKSIYKKNLIRVIGRPVLDWPMLALKGSAYNINSYVSTDCQQISDAAERVGLKTIWRSRELSADDTNHGDTIIDAFNKVDAIHGVPHIYLILIGNTVMINSNLIDEAVTLLVNSKEASGVMTVWEAADDHPYRAMRLNENGFLMPFEDRIVSTDRHSYPPAYFYDQGVWAVKSQYLRAATGPSPWYWMGPNPLPLVRPWITGRDINGPFDVLFHEYWPQLSKTPKNFLY